MLPLFSVGQVCSSQILYSRAAPRRRRSGPPRGTHHKESLFPKDLLQRLSLCQLVDQLVQIPDLPHQWVLDLLHPDAADGPCDLPAAGVHPGRFPEKGPIVYVQAELPLWPSAADISSTASWRILFPVPYHPSAAFFKGLPCQMAYRPKASIYSPRLLRFAIMPAVI